MNSTLTFRHSLNQASQVPNSSSQSSWVQTPRTSRVQIPWADRVESKLLKPIKSKLLEPTELLPEEKTCPWHAFGCPYSGCNKSSESLNWLLIHFGKPSKSARFQTSKNKSWAKAVVQSPPGEHQVVLAAYSWDNEDSICYELDKAAIGNFVEDNNDDGAPSNWAGIYSKSTNDAALRSSICFTTERCHKTKLLKVISNDSALQNFYKAPRCHLHSLIQYHPGWPSIEPGH
jgi:hypothetical protein